MSTTPERPGAPGANEPILKLVLPTFYAPCEADFWSTNVNYAKNPSTFILATQDRISLDNLALFPFFQVNPCIPIPALAYKWAYIYYGMVEAAADRHQLPPLNVSGETVAQYIKIQKACSVNGLSSEQKEDKTRLEWTRRKSQDIVFSSGFSMFWDQVERDIETARASGKSECDILSALLPVMTIQALFQKQQGKYNYIQASIENPE
jgi:hypothetical protein